jgi:hypothetical protein
MNAKLDSVSAFPAGSPVPVRNVARVPVYPEQVATPYGTRFRKDDQERRGLRPHHPRLAFPARTGSELFDGRPLSIDLFRAIPWPGSPGLDLWETLSYLALEACVLLGITLCFW